MSVHSSLWDLRRNSLVICSLFVLCRLAHCLECSGWSKVINTKLLNVSRKLVRKSHRYICWFVVKCGTTVIIECCHVAGCGIARYDRHLTCQKYRTASSQNFTSDDRPNLTFWGLAMTATNNDQRHNLLNDVVHLVISYKCTISFSTFSLLRVSWYTLWPSNLIVTGRMAEWAGNVVTSYSKYTFSKAVAIGTIMCLVMRNIAIVYYCACIQG